MRKRLARIGLGIFLLCAWSQSSQAEANFSTYRVGTNVYLVVNQQNVIKLGSGLAGLTALERLELVRTRLGKQFAGHRLGPQSFQIGAEGPQYGIRCNGSWLITADQVTASRQGLTQLQLAKLWWNNLRNAFSGGSDSPAERGPYYGFASWYGRDFRGRLTANGEHFDETKYSAAHRSLPFGTRLRVTNLRTHLMIVVTVNDRGPWIGKRVLDLSWAAAQAIKIRGVDYVKYEILAY